MKDKSKRFKGINLSMLILGGLVSFIVISACTTSSKQAIEMLPQNQIAEEETVIAPDEVSEDEVVAESQTNDDIQITEDAPQPPPKPIAPQFAPPATYGFVESTDLPEIGVRALLPENSKVYYRADLQKEYDIDFPEKYTGVSFTIYDYSGGGRRTWFRTNIGRPGSVYESFGSNNHQGYITYFKDTDGILYDLYYFTVVRSNKMLVVRYDAAIHHSELDKFRSFVSTVSITDVQEETIENKRKRFSETRKTIWENADYGLRIIALEWIEDRYIIKKNEDGSVEYSEWKKTYPEVSFYEGEHGYGEGKGKSIYVKGFYSAGGAAIYLLSSEYTGETFTDVINDVLPAAGYCMDEWDDPISECKGRPYCYAKNEVIENLVLRKTAQFGPYPAQLRGINTAFSVENDCRGSDIWLIQAKGGQYALSIMSPDGEDFKLEGF